jgi:hypothetical protein
LEANEISGKAGTLNLQNKLNDICLPGSVDTQNK